MMNPCFKCGEMIFDRTLLSTNDNKYWHLNCLACDKCFTPLYNAYNNRASCFFKNGMVLCKADYYMLAERLAAICSDCNAIVHPHDFVHKIPCLPMQNSMNSMNERSFIYYHPACLKCCRCQNFLRKGDKYIIKPDNLGIVCLNNDCATDFRVSPINPSINPAAPAGRKRGRQSNASVKVKAEKTQNQFQM